MAALLALLLVWLLIVRPLNDARANAEQQDEEQDQCGAHQQIFNCGHAHTCNDVEHQ